MAFSPIPIDRENLIFCGVSFPDLDTLNKVANAIGSNMFEGFEPTQKSVEIIRDYVMGKITLSDLTYFAKKRVLYG
jgi:putative transcriptional regulator